MRLARANRRIGSERQIDMVEVKRDMDDNAKHSFEYPFYGQLLHLLVGGLAGQGKLSVVQSAKDTCM